MYKDIIAVQNVNPKQGKWRKNLHQRHDSEGRR